MKATFNRWCLSAAAAVLVLGVGLAGSSTFAAQVPALDDPNMMSREVGQRLGPIFTLHDAQKFAEADAAMQQLRADFESRLSDYEKLRVLQTSAIINSSLQKYPEAIADYEALLQIEGVPTDARLTAADILAQLYFQQSDWSKAVEHLLEVNELQDNENEDTLFRIAYAHSQSGDIAAAIPFMEQAMELAGEQAAEDYYRTMATLYMQAESPDKAITTYEKFLEVYPASANREAIAANLAALYIQVGNKTKAISLLRALIREYPTSARLPTYRQSLDALNSTP